jgi:hypothetical protein
MTDTDTDEQTTALARAMRQEIPVLVATYERLGVFASADEANRQLLLSTSTVAMAMAIATMSPVAWLLGVVGLCAWKWSWDDRVTSSDPGR